MNPERKEALLRVPIGIVSGLILGIWKMLIQVLAIVHWFMVLFTGKRNKSLADFSEIWNAECYRYLRYMTFVSNQRSWPFGKLGKPSK